MKESSQKSPPPTVRVFPSPVTTVALAIALIAAVLFSFMRLMAPADDAVLEGEPAASQGVEASDSESAGQSGSSGGPSSVEGPGASADGGESSADGVPGARGGDVEDTRGGFVMVQVTGAVKTPSVVRVPAGARGMDAVNKAGGLTEDASLASVNLAVQVADGQHIHVLTNQEASDAGLIGASSNSAGGAGGSAGLGGSGSGAGVAGPGSSGNGIGPGASTSCIDVRTADQVTLQLLPGIGPALAARIDAYRAENGLKNPEDIRGVSGIGAKTYDGFKDMLCP